MRYLLDISSAFASHGSPISRYQSLYTTYQVDSCPCWPLYNGLLYDSCFDFEQVSLFGISAKYHILNSFVVAIISQALIPPFTLYGTSEKPQALYGLAMSFAAGNCCRECS